MSVSATTDALTGRSLVGGDDVHPEGPTFRAVDPVSGAELEPAYGEAGPAEVELAAQLAAQAFPEYRKTTVAVRAAFLDSIAANIEALGASLSDRVTAETGLPAARVAGETARTVGQLRMFATVVRTGEWRQVRIDPALPDRTPLPRPDLRQRSVPLGPVAVFGASNFPLAFSVAGGDTVAALAAGCPVIVKGHPAHPGSSELVGRAIRDAVVEHGLPAGTFALLHGTSHELGLALATDRRVKAVAFTGSRTAGLALVAAAQQRPEPIPVFAEMSAVNPVFVLPGALAERAQQTSEGFVAAVTGSAGQLCTKPGLLFLLEAPEADAFLAAVAGAVKSVPTAPMLTPGIQAAFERGASALATTPGVQRVAVGSAAESPAAPGRAQLFLTTGEVFRSRPGLSDEVFGPAALIVRVRDEAELSAIVDAVEGQLTATVHLGDADHPLAAALLEQLELVAGRVIVNGWPTGVDVGHAIVHGGPFPATSAPATTSVGTRAIERFLRAVAYQNVPDDLLPTELRRGNPDSVPRLVDGERA